MFNYVRNFVKHNRSNEVGLGLLVVSGFVAGFYVIFACAAVIQGEQIEFGWWSIIPVGLIVLSVAHLILRPVVMEYYQNN